MTVRDTLMSSGLSAWLLPAMLLWPLLAAPLVRLLGRDGSRVANGVSVPSGGIDARVLTLIALTVEAALGIAAWIIFSPGTTGWQITSNLPWIPDLGARLTLGVDGLSLPMLVMTVLVMPLTLVGTWNNVTVKTPSYGALVLALTSGLVGVLIALDLLLFYVSWELMLIPTYFIIGIWGGDGRTKAVIKYVVMTMFGSLLMLLAIASLWTQGGGTSFAFDHFAGLQLSHSVQLWMFGAFFLAFALKSGLVPFHSWMPGAQQAAPTLGAITLGLKVGMYAMLRFAIPLFPAAATDPTVRSIIIVVSVISIIYGAMVAMAQTDLKRLISYSSISHVGFITLGCFALTTQGLQGATWITVNHGITTTALFLLAGVLYDRKGTNLMVAFGGLAKVVPLFSIMLTLSILSTVGLPGTNGFIGEFLVLLGTFAGWPVIAGVATTVVILAAVYGLRALQTILFGRLDETSNGALRDLSIRETSVMTVFAVAMIWLGLAPHGLLQRIEAGTNRVQANVSAAGNVASSPSDPPASSVSTARVSKTIVSLGSTGAR